MPVSAETWLEATWGVTYVRMTAWFRVDPPDLAEFSKYVEWHGEPDIVRVTHRPLTMAKTPQEGTA